MGGDQDSEAMVSRLLEALGVQSMAQGGVVTEPTLSLLGEQGPEAVVPLGYRKLRQQVRRSASPYGPGGELDRFFRNLVGGGDKAGAFDPLGSKALLDLIQRIGTEEGAARSRSTDLGIQAGGADLDPSQFGFLRQMGQLRSQSDTSRALSGARLQSTLGNQKFIQDLAQMLFQALQGKQSQERDIAQRRRESQQQGMGGLLDLIGTLGGAAVGAGGK
jgi:hypothetical protein